MKLEFQEKKEIKEVEVSVLYGIWDEEVEQIKNSLQKMGKYLSGDENGRQYRIPVYSIYYIESMERKTFIYTKNEVYCSRRSLNETMKNLPETDFVQISKSCALNINMLKSVRVLPNSKLEALLANEEKVIVTRNYLKRIREKLEG